MVISHQPVLRSSAVLLAWVEIRVQVFSPRRHSFSDQSLAAKKETRRALPGAPPEQRSVAIQVIDSLAKDVQQKSYRDPAEPGQSPSLVAAQGLVDIEGRALVFRLLGAVPEPERFEPRISFPQHVCMIEQPVSKDRREMFVGSGDAQPMLEVHTIHPYKSLA